MLRYYVKTLAIILLAIFCLYFSFQNWMNIQRTWNPSLVLNDPESRWETKILAIKLPAKIGNQIGYVADWDLNPAYNPVDQDEEYVLTQYTLAPLIVRKGSGYEWMVGNFTLPGANEWLSRNFKGATINYYGFGIYLIHRTGQ